MDTTLDGLRFRSDFDSGNMERVRKDPYGGYKLWIRPDCADNEAVGTNYRTWFHFSVGGGKQGETITLKLVNMNDKSNMYIRGMQPVMRSVPSDPKWRLLKTPVGWIESEYQAERDDLVWSRWHKPKLHTATCPCKDADQKGGHPERHSKQPMVPTINARAASPCCFFAA